MRQTAEKAKAGALLAGGGDSRWVAGRGLAVTRFERGGG